MRFLSFNPSRGTAFPLFLAVLSIASAPLSAESWRKGEALPDLQPFQLEGSLPELEGKVVLLDFWASWCLPCRASFPTMDELYGEYKDDGLVVVAVSVDRNPKARDRFVKQLGPSFVTLGDPEHRLVSETGLQVMPTSYLIGRDGRIAFVHEGWRGEPSKLELESRITELIAEER